MQQVYQNTLDSYEQTLEQIEKEIKDQKIFVCIVLNEFDVDSLVKDGKLKFSTVVLSRGIIEEFSNTIQESVIQAFNDSLQVYFNKLEQEKTVYPIQ